MFSDKSLVHSVVHFFGVCLLSLLTTPVTVLHLMSRKSWFSMMTSRGCKKLCAWLHWVGLLAPINGTYFHWVQAFRGKPNYANLRPHSTFLSRGFCLKIFRLNTLRLKMYLFSNVRQAWGSCCTGTLKNSSAELVTSAGHALPSPYCRKCNKDSWDLTTILGFPSCFKMLLHSP